MSFPFLQNYLGLSSGLQTRQAAGGGSAVGGWKELGRTTLGSANANIAVSSLSNKRYYMFLINTLGKSSYANDDGFRLGYGSVDSGNNYAHRNSINGVADVTGVSSTLINQVLGGANAPVFRVGYIANYSSKEKLVMHHHVEQNTAGAGTAPVRYESVGKWTNTSNVLDTINQYSGGSATFNTGSEVVVLGWDPADTHTTNFWEELADVSLSGGIIDTGVFTAKKYLWIQGYCITGTVTGGFATMYCGNSTIDKGTSYSERSSVNGGTDGISVNQSTNGLFRLLGQGGSNNNEITFFNTFIINNSANEKLFISNSTWGSKTGGSGTSNNRTEGIAKWTNTSAQLNRISIEYVDSGSLSAGTIKVWGAN